MYRLKRPTKFPGSNSHRLNKVDMHVAGLSDSRLVASCQCSCVRVCSPSEHTCWSCQQAAARPFRFGTPSAKLSVPAAHPHQCSNVRTSSPRISQVNLPAVSLPAEQSALPSCFECLHLSTKVALQFIAAVLASAFRDAVASRALSIEHSCRHTSSTRTTRSRHALRRYTHRCLGGSRLLGACCRSLHRRIRHHDPIFHNSHPLHTRHAVQSRTHNHTHNHDPRHEYHTTNPDA